MQELDYPFDGATIIQKKRSLKRALLEQQGLTPKKVAIMSGSTIGEIKNVLELFLLHAGIKPEFHIGGYALYYENLLFDDGTLSAFAPDILYIHTSAQNITDWPSQQDSPEVVEDKLNITYTRFERMWQAAASFGCPIIQNNFEQPYYRLMGNRDAVDVHGRVNFVNRLNLKFAEYAAKTPNFHLNDIQYMAACAGIDNWFSPATWYAYKYALDTPYIATLCHSIARIVKSLFGKNKKSVILDLDNTLWGGIIGDDGAEGIVLGKETPTGMAYSEFQAYLKELTGLGVVLNVCSKNEESNALAGFARADSTLKRDDFLCFKANWEPKHVNVAHIAQEINLGTDAFVFMDDNPAEREIVKNEIVGISVPELHAPEMYLKALDRAGYFEVTSLSADDKKRNEMYRQNANRVALAQTFGDYSDYLRSLAMRVELGTFDTTHVERITQLINKTNQFNLTTQRYTASEVEALITTPDAITIYGRLVDKFGDNGIVTALIAHVQGTEATIDLWVMSCRTFKRNLEHAMFDFLVATCAKRGVQKINGNYLPTAKNLLVSNFYATIGFEKTHEDENGGKLFSFTAFDGYTPQNTVMETIFL